MVKCNLLIIVVCLTILNFLLLTAVLLKQFTRIGCPNARTNLIQKERIVGGRSVSIDKFRFIAGIIIEGTSDTYLQCGSSIISAHWVISASHCVDLLRDFPLNFLYIASGHKEWKKGTRHQIERMIKHPNYVNFHFYNDTALIKVKEPFNMSVEMPVTLAGPNYAYKANSSATVIGWGVNVTGAGTAQKTLFTVDILIFSQEYCDKMWDKGSVTADMFCAGTYEGGRDACQFDSGGPIVQKDILLGIVSWGGECGHKTQPGVYARMSYFIPWLTSFEKEENIKIGYHVQNSNV